MTIKRKILIAIAVTAAGAVIRSAMQGRKLDEVKDQMKSLASNLVNKSKEFFSVAKEKVNSAVL